ncbi:Uncharacterized conserved protein [Aedoeadaptatus ivorii]|uniref:Uncharacterized conserved protein n=1 Tax=Aedoeadaptatus ivorii TaxID=54006 RepID=A0A3S4YKV1_9FIRM|nr:threonine/serine exporter family protein [Peptoniphilus ivorii]MDQ0507855.1 uncharacterized membrane protein YjjB (DUF3815 family) [Peptoniphilus ivorii]VEJ35682.1 Uncharacterized conserved protein [Peptoniphilus ivorii]
MSGNILLLFIISVAATIGYVVPVDAPKRAILPGAVIGAIAYLIYLKVMDLGGNAFFGAFVAAFMIGSCGELCSRIFKMPSTIFSMSGLITLVPGGGMYYTMSYLIQENMDLFLKEAVKTFSIAIALSVGIVASTLFSRSLKSFRQRSMKNSSRPFGRYRDFPSIKS